ncbi:DNA-binding LytR/AlgR family response regulator [Pedobacter cryoconitis]|uniref:DNA-binding LytR/AlgR family response regulator n=1 Tax=Pedobacter cryoconitis TaxID=188932 RepID=A0A7W8ZQU5_9SPHI|nr:LytTR family DNA-binding domain-containing protein [Pedobacter cryoconitis]MBB5638353.1 DNA-binding LytR/AlgR family response regulator [Pedobacter cryoconitis]
MKKINCIIADDEPLARNVIKNHISRLERLQVVAICTNGAEAFRAMKEIYADLIFLDIQMPQVSGLDLLRTVTKRPAVIITTAYKEFALDGFDLNVLDYLVKPISFERFLQAIDKYENSINPGLSDYPRTLTDTNLVSSEPFIYVKTEKKRVKIELQEILYLEGIKDHIRINTLNHGIVTYQSLNYFEERLPDNLFLRIHRSLIVGINHINSFSASKIEIGEASFPIGRTYLKKVAVRLQNL